ncbi:MAG: glycosyltransferase [Candidatus Altiarchaeota archaeon]
MCGGVDLIYVTCGMHTHGFERLVRAMDEIAEKTREKVVIQRGSTAYLPRFSRFSDFYPRDDAESLIKGARVVVSHAGIGTIIQALNFERPLILVPRLKKFQEHNNDHQLEVAREVAKIYGVPTVLDVSDIKNLLEKVKPIKRKTKGKEKIIKCIKEFLAEAD